MGSIARVLTDVAIIGAGTQGRRLAHMWTSCGNDVHLVDERQCQLDDAVRYVDQLRTSAEYQGIKWGRVLLHSASELHEALRNSWLIIESIPERLSAKKQVIAQLDAAASSDTIIASNSSSYTIAEIIEGLILIDSSRILSAHSYWPPETAAIEIMGHDRTRSECITTMLERCKAHRFEPFHVKRSSTGYIYNRIWAAIKREALLVAAEEVATAVEIDQIFKSVLGARMGPFEQMDVVGLDVVLDIEEHYAQARSGIPLLPRTYLKNILASGRRGIKNGKGFYDYEEDH